MSEFILETETKTLTHTIDARYLYVICCSKISFQIASKCTI